MLLPGTNLNQLLRKRDHVAPQSFSDLPGHKSLPSATAKVTHALLARMRRR